MYVIIGKQKFIQCNELKNLLDDHSSAPTFKPVTSFVSADIEAGDGGCPLRLERCSVLYLGPGGQKVQRPLEPCHFCRWRRVE